jgi:hypothetical protein
MIRLTGKKNADGTNEIANVCQYCNEDIGDVDIKTPRREAGGPTLEHYHPDCAARTIYELRYPSNFASERLMAKAIESGKHAAMDV